MIYYFFAYPASRDLLHTTKSRDLLYTHEKCLCVPTTNPPLSLKFAFLISLKTSDRTSRKTDFRKLKITLATMTYHRQHPQWPSLSPHVLLTVLALQLSGWFDCHTNEIRWSPTSQWRILPLCEPRHEPSRLCACVCLAFVPVLVLISPEWTWLSFALFARLVLFHLRHWNPGGGDSHMKRAGMIVVLLRG